MQTFKQHLKREANPNSVLPLIKEDIIPKLLMCMPYNMSADEPNNIWMKELKNLPESESKIDVNKAVQQWYDVYNLFSSESVVHILPTVKGLQDQVYTANLGIVLPHLDINQVVISNFTSPPRVKEAQVGLDFFKQFDYNVIQCPYKWEGEADLKFVRDNIYIGGFGQRTQYEALEWFEQIYNMKLHKLEMVDEYLYHLDCSVFPMDTNTVMICSEMFDKEELKDLEKDFDLVDVNADDAYFGITNSVRLGKTIYSHSNIQDLKSTDEFYDGEKHKIDSMVKICSENGFEPIFVNISEMTKSGALASCLTMHLSYPEFMWPCK